MPRFLLVCVCCAALAAGCATPSYRQASATTGLMDETARSLDRASREINGTINTLNSFQGLSGQDLRNQYQNFVRQVNNMERQRRRVQAQENRLETRSRRYFSAWERELRRFANPTLKRKSRQRRQLAIDEFNQLFDALQVADQSYNIILNDMKDIRRYLGFDLTTESVDVIRENIAKANRDAAEVQKNIEEALRELRQTPAPLPTETASGPAPVAPAPSSGGSQAR